MAIGFLLSLIILILITSIEVPTGNLGKFERERRKQQGGRDVDRELAYTDIVSLQHVLTALGLVATVAFSVASFGWFWGILLGVLIALEYGVVAKLPVLRRWSLRLYTSIEPWLLHVSQEYGSILRYVRVNTPDSPELQLRSREELIHLLEQAKRAVLSDDEKQRLLAGLQFADVEVRDIMTPRSMIDAINKTDVLGPLVLDDLHKKGHSRFPVIEGDVDHVVGVLHLRDVLRVDTSRKHTAKVESAMESVVYYIHEQQTASHALAAFIKTHHHLFIVVNEFRETVGLLTLEDVIETMIGAEIVDEFDTHDDLRAVASRQPRGNTTAQQSEDV